MAMYLLFTGKTLSAREMHALGFVCEVHPADALANATLALAQLIAAKSPAALRRMKEVARASADKTRADDGWVLVDTGLNSTDTVADWLQLTAQGPLPAASMVMLPSFENNAAPACPSWYPLWLRLPANKVTSPWGGTL